MQTVGPSRQVLRYLSRLCSSLETFTPAAPIVTRRSICTRRPFQTLTQRQRYPKASTATKTLRTFTTTIPSRHATPNEAQDPDPQNTATAVLPDITNYYTLFPQTIPNGPPSPGPREQSPEPSLSSPAATDNTASSSPTFHIHLPTLRQEFLRLQSTHHPDKFPTGAQSHQKALALSSYINSAYKTLSDPLLRAQYLLQLQYDIDVTSEDNAAHPTDQETLMEVMEAQERVENARGQDEVDLLKDENRERIVVTEMVLGEAFEHGDMRRAKDEAVRLKYWRSLQGALDEWEEGKEVRLVH